MLGGRLGSRQKTAWTVLAQDSRYVRNSFRGKEVSALSHGRACMVACAFFAGSVVYIQTGVLNTMHAHVFTLNSVVCTSVHMCVHTRYRMCICADVCAVCSFIIGDHY